MHHTGRSSLVLLTCVSILVIAGTVGSQSVCPDYCQNLVCRCNGCASCENKINELQLCDMYGFSDYCFCNEVEVTVDVSASGTCINWDRSGVTLKCNGHRITGSGSGDGIYLNGVSGNTLDNCEITEFGTGIMMFGADSNTVTGCDVHGNKLGIDVNVGDDGDGSDGNLIEYSSMENNTDYGIFLYSSDNNRIEVGNTISNNGYNESGSNYYSGIYAFGTEGTVIKGNVIASNSGEGIDISSGMGIPDTENIAVSHGDCYDTDGDGYTDGCDYDGDGTIDNPDEVTQDMFDISVGLGGSTTDMSSNLNVIEDNTIAGNGRDGIYIGAGSILNMVKDNNVNDNGDSGLYLMDTAYNTVEGNILENNEMSGIYVASSYGNAIKNNPGINYNKGKGIYLQLSDGNGIDGNSVEGNGEEGILLYRSNSNDIVSNPLVSGNNEGEGSGLGLEYLAGIGLDRSDGNLIEGNTIADENKNAICIKKSDQNEIKGNTIYNSQGHGIYLYQSDTNNITSDNSITGNLEGNGILLEKSNENLIENTIVSGNGKDGIMLDGSDGNRILSGNSITENQAGNGIYLDSSDSNWIEYSTVSNNGENGIYLRNSGNNVMGCMNTISNNGGNGIFVEMGYGNIIASNSIGNNDANGIYLKTSQGNRLDQNVVCNNGEADIKQSVDLSSGDNNNCDEVDKWDDEGTEGCTNSCSSAPPMIGVGSADSEVAAPVTESPAEAPVGFVLSMPGGISSMEVLGVLVGLLAIYLIIGIVRRV